MTGTKWRIHSRIEGELSKVWLLALKHQNNALPYLYIPRRYVSGGMGIAWPWHCFAIRVAGRDWGGLMIQCYVARCVCGCFEIDLFRKSGTVLLFESYGVLFDEAYWI